MPATQRAPTARQTPTKPSLNTQNDLTMDQLNPQQWLNFSLPPRQRNIPGSGMTGGGLPRRSRRGDSWRGSAMTREKYVNANFRFVLKPTMTGSYGAHFADPDISLHWPNILQVLVPTFSPLSVAQGYVSSDPSSSTLRSKQSGTGSSQSNIGILGTSFDSTELEGMGEEAAERRRRIEEEKMGRSCPICLGKPVAGRMTKCGHIFCFPCILHYIQLSDIPKSAKCPICGDTVHEGMLKSVRYLDADTMLRAAQGEDDEAEMPRVVDDAAAGYDLDHRAESDTHDHDISLLGEMEGFESHHIGTTSSVDPANRDSSTTTQRIHMRLIQRPQMTTMALPTSSTWPSEALPPHTAPWYFLPDVLTYSHFMLATPSYMYSELQRELGELANEWEIMKGDELGRDFVRAAKEKVERQVGKVKDELETDGVRRGEREIREAWGEAVGGEKRERERRKERERKAREREERLRLEKELNGNAEDLGNIPVEFLATQNNFGQFALSPAQDPSNIPLGPNPLSHLLNTISNNSLTTTSPKKNRKKPTPGGGSTGPPTPPPPSYYFYQSTLGVNVFLHPLDIRILLSYFKSYSLFPTTISFFSEGSDPGTINEDLRKRCKYLAHLPAGTEVVFVEAELEEVVGKEGLMPFEQALKARRGKRRDRVKKEDKAKSRWEKAEREKLPVDLRSGGNGNGYGGGQDIPDDRDFAIALARSTLDSHIPTSGNGWSSAEDSTGLLGSSPNFVPGSASSSTYIQTPFTQVQSTGLSPPTTSLLGTSPIGFTRSPNPWSTSPSRPTFATALNNHTTSSTPLRSRMGNGQTELDWEVEEAWGAFTRLNAGDGDDRTGDDELSRGSVRESEKGGGRGGKGGKKKNQKKLILGGGGGRRA